jgi:hypothetical protein
MSTKHSPHPFTCALEEESFSMVIRNNRGQMITRIPLGSEEQLYNSYLFVAAPELLAFMEKNCKDNIEAARLIRRAKFGGE